MGGRSVDPDTSASCGGGEWVPKLIQIRGWAALGLRPRGQVEERGGRRSRQEDLLAVCGGGSA